MPIDHVVDQQPRIARIEAVVRAQLTARRDADRRRLGHDRRPERVEIVRARRRGAVRLCRFAGYYHAASFLIRGR